MFSPKDAWAQELMDPLTHVDRGNCVLFSADVYAATSPVWLQVTVTTIADTRVKFSQWLFNGDAVVHPLLLEAIQVSDHRNGVGVTEV